MTVKTEKIAIALVCSVLLALKPKSSLPSCIIEKIIAAISSSSHMPGGYLKPPLPLNTALKIKYVK